MPTDTVMDPDSLLRRVLSAPDGPDRCSFLAQLREDHPVHRTGDGVYVFSRYAEVSVIARDPAFAVKDAGWFDTHVPGWRASAGMRLFCSSMLFHDGRSHQRLRKVLTAALAPSRLRLLLDVVRQSTEHHLDALDAERSDGGVVDLHGLVTLPVTRATGCALIGVPERDGAMLYDLVQPLLALLDPEVGLRTVLRSDRAAKALRPYLDELIADRRARPGADLASLAAALSDDEAASALMLALAAGFDTTVTLLDNAVSALLSSAARAPVAAGDPVVVDAAVHEALRLAPPIQLITRIARHEVTVGGVRLEAGQEVMALIVAAHRDPDEFREPETFDVRRPTGQLLSFGGGAHYCLGAQLAKLEASVVLPAVLRRFPRMAATGGPQMNGRVTVRGWSDFPVAPHG
ncbi:cytochrome P450 [Streptomyces sp. NPDC058122]|uniref:cytochrome P450 n=1 Tax=Streptomyces sp. NPDC058122 TaxID=3346349 RepID=UPI0036ECB289